MAHRRDSCLKPRFDTLGARTLLSGMTTVFSLPFSAPIVSADTRGPKLAAAPGGGIASVQLDGNLHFPISAIAADGTVSVLHDPSASPFRGSGAVAAAYGSDGRLYFAGFGLPNIARLDPSGLIVGTGSYPADGYPQGLTLGPDGAIWSTYATGGALKRGIHRLLPDNTTTDFPLYVADGMTLGGIATGSDGALWFTQPGFLGAASKIGRITTDGAFSEYLLPFQDATPADVALGPDGNIWFTAWSTSYSSSTGVTGVSRIGKITPGGVITEYELSASVAKTNPKGTLGQIVAGPQGALWFTEPDGNALGRITPDGQISTFPFAWNTAELGTSLVATPGGSLGGGSLWYSSRPSPAQVSRYDVLTTMTSVGTTLGLAQDADFQGTVAVFADNAPQDVSSYTATIDWGDGTTSSGIITPAPESGRYLVTGDHAYASAQTFQAYVTIHRQLDDDATGAPVTVIVARPPDPTPEPTPTPEPLPIPVPVPTPGPTFLTPPRVVRVVGLGPSGRRIVRVVLTYDQPVDAASVVDARRYRILAPGRDGRYDTADDVKIRVRGAQYEASTLSVILTPNVRLSRQRNYRVRLEGADTVRLRRSLFV